MQKEAKQVIAYTDYSLTPDAAVGYINTFANQPDITFSCNVRNEDGALEEILAFSPMKQTGVDGNNYVPAEQFDALLAADFVCISAKENLNDYLLQDGVLHKPIEESFATSEQVLFSMPYSEKYGTDSDYQADHQRRKS